VIHAHLLSTSVYGSIAGFLLRIPVVSTFHGQVDVSESERFVGAKLRIIDRPANHVTFVSASLRRNMLAKLPFKRAHTSVVENGIDLEAFIPLHVNGSHGQAQIRNELGVADDEVLIGAIGNVRPSKAYDVLLRAVARLKETGRKFRAVIVGQREGIPGLYESLSALQAELGLGRAVEFVGFRDDIPDVMRGLDIYVCSSHAEGFSLTTVQAMSVGIPVVATRCGGPEEIVTDGVTGTLVPTNSPDALAAALSSFVDDPALRAAVGLRARAEAVSRYGVERMVRGYERVYEEALGLRTTSA
jgi:glycosyltransferase involved in cell wall biosynthesis